VTGPSPGVGGLRSKPSNLSFCSFLYDIA